MTLFSLVILLGIVLRSEGFSDDEKYFKIKSYASEEFSEYCLELNETESSIIINTCDTSKRNQRWNVDDHSRIHNDAIRSGCIFTNSTGTDLFYETFCSQPVSQLNRRYSKFSYSLFDSKLLSGYKAMEIVGIVQNGSEVKVMKPKVRLTQKWVLDFVALDEQLKFVDNPPPLPLGICSGDCDFDSDCDGDLRCINREMKNNREIVPGCFWGEDSDIERYLAKDYCFDPVDRSTDSVVSYVGECGSHNPDPYPFYKCKECQGSCHYDDDCGNGLKCKHRVGYEAVPGCTGEAGEFDVYGKNICYNPSLPDVGLGATDCALTNDCAICTNCTVDNDCQGELRCAVRDADKTVPGCSITQATTPSLSSDTNICFRPLTFPGNAGVINYVGCSQGSYLCSRCEAGCTADNDCAGNLVCKIRTAFESVPGCFHEEGPLDMAGKGVCFEDITKPQLHPCRDHKCPVCGGGCHKDEDCIGHLRCAKRDGLEDVPGCAWGVDTTLHDFLGDMSYCFDPFIETPAADDVTYIGECSPDIPGYLCGECEGGCKYDFDCQFDLKCLHRTGFDDVPGCRNEGGERDVWMKGICYDPAKFPIL